jgi:hypothetical protein
MMVFERQIQGLLGLFLLWITTTEAFVVKGHFGVVTTRTGRYVPALVTRSVLTRQRLHVDVNDNSMWLAPAVQPSSFLVSDAMQIVTNVLVGVGGIVVVLAGVAFLLSSFIIPKAAEQIEVQAKELDPALWQEYADKLEPGEVLAMRPDLMQELGNKVQALALSKFEEMQESAKKPPVESVTTESDTTVSSPSQPPTSKIVDVEVLSKNWED